MPGNRCGLAKHVNLSSQVTQASTMLLNPPLQLIAVLLTFADVKALLQAC